MDSSQVKAKQDIVIFLSSSGEGCHLGRLTVGDIRVAQHFEVSDAINKADFVRAIKEVL